MARVRFQIQAKNYFITYARCNKPKEELLQKLIELPYPINPVYIRVAREEHADGTPHLHVLVQFSGKWVCNNHTFFDFPNPNRPVPFHPNIQGARSSTDVQNYISKHGDYCDYGTFQKDKRTGRRSPTDQVTLYTDVINAPDAATAIKMVKEMDPVRYITQRHCLLPNIEREFSKPPEPFVSRWDPASFNKVPEEIMEWARRNICEPAARPERPTSIIIEGPTKTGKTQWARSLGPHNHIQGFLDFNSKIYNEQSWYNVIDDVSPHYLYKKHWKDLIGSQTNWQTNSKYRKPILIKGGIPTIVLCNPGGTNTSYMTYLDSAESEIGLKEWTLNNAEYYFINEPLFTISPEGDTSGSQETPAAAQAQALENLSFDSASSRWNSHVPVRLLLGSGRSCRHRGSN